MLTSSGIELLSENGKIKLEDKTACLKPIRIRIKDIHGDKYQ